MKFYISRALALSAWFIGSNLSSESMSVGDVIYVSLVTMGISVRVASLNIAVTVTVLLSSLFEVTGMMVSSNDIEAILVGNGLRLWK